MLSILSWSIVSADPKTLCGDRQIPGFGLDGNQGLHVIQTEQNWIYRT
jgi:hypothetical protein